MINIWKELNSKKILNEGCLYEGSHYDKDAAKILSEVCNIETAEKIIDSLIKADWVSIFTHTNWIYKFLKPVARIFVEETKKGKALSDVIQDNVDMLGQFLVYVKDNQEKKDELFNFFNEAHIEDIKKFMNDLQAEMERMDKESAIELTGNDYEVVKIKSYEHLHSLFGGAATGDGKSDKAADNTYGRGATAWCHANDVSMYDTHTKNGKYLMFVAAKKGWQNIPPEQTEGNPLDEYGLSLIAIVSDRIGNLLETTLRWNHVGVKLADHVFKTWGQLNNACNQDIQKECSKYFMEDNPNIPYLVEGTTVIGMKDENVVSELNIQEGITEIDDKAFYEYSCKLESVSLPNSLIRIGNRAFSGCTGLVSVNIPEGVQEIGIGAFSNTGIKSIKLPKRLTTISNNLFGGCGELSEISIHEGIESIGRLAFGSCSSLTHVELPRSLKILGEGAFSSCHDLTNVTFNKGIEQIGNTCFAFCEHLTKIVLPEGLKSIGDGAFNRCYKLQEVVIPNTVVEMNGFAFLICPDLKSIKLPDRFVNKNFINSIIQSVGPEVIINGVSAGEYQF